MKLEAKTIMQNGKFGFDIIDTGDAVDYNGVTLHESIYSSDWYSNEQTSDRNSLKWISTFNGSSEAVRRKLCGYDTQSDCRVTARRLSTVRKSC